MLQLAATHGVPSNTNTHPTTQAAAISTANSNSCTAVHSHQHSHHLQRRCSNSPPARQQQLCTTRLQLHKACSTHGGNSCASCCQCSGTLTAGLWGASLQCVPLQSNVLTVGTPAPAAALGAPRLMTGIAAPSTAAQPAQGTPAAHQTPGWLSAARASGATPPAAAPQEQEHVFLKMPLPVTFWL